MLKSWLKWNERNPCPYSQFKVIDVQEATDLSPEVTAYLQSVLQEARYEPKFLEDMTNYLGWEGVKESIIKREIPTFFTAKRGNFGEILTGIILEQFHGYRIPVQKLRFKIIANQSLPATDVLALKIGQEDSIVEVCYVESKLRTSPHNNMAAINGYEQLLKDYESRLPDILHFIAARLHERNDPLFHPFASYMRDRRDTTEMDTFRLGLCWEQSHWSELVLQNLEENQVALPRLTIHVICISGIRELIDELFSKFGVTGIYDDE